MAIVVAVLVVVPLVSMAASLRSTPRELDVLQQRDAPVAVVIDASTTWQPSTAAAVTLHFDASRAATVVAPPWKGTVTAVLVAAGTELHAGDPVVEIDGIRRVFAPSPAPFWRVPAWGDHGPDVDGLTALFASLQLMPAQDRGTVFGAAHVQAVERLASLIGAPPSSTLDLGWLVWSVAPTLTVASSSLALGGAAPAPGSTLFPAPRTIKAVDVVPADGSHLADDALRRSTVDFGADGTVPGAQLLDAPAQVPALRRLSAPVAPVGGAAASAAGPDASPPGEATSTRNVTVRGDRVEHVAALPLSAVVTDSDGSHCVVSLDRRAVPVEVIGSDAARTYVRGADQQQVAANPASAFGVTRCH